MSVWSWLATKNRGYYLAGYVILVLLGLWTAFPVYWQLATSLRSDADLYTPVVALIPRAWTLEHYYNVLFGARLMGEDADVPRLLELSGLAPSFAGRDASQLSVGEQQRVMLARALALGPEVLLLDEPTSALDASARDAVEGTLLHLREELDLSYVIVTHDLDQAARLADWVLRLDLGGRAVGHGSARDLLAR